MSHGVRQTEFFVILGYLLPFHQQPSPHHLILKIKILKKKKKKKMFGDNILLYIHVYHKSRSYDKYGSWNISCDRNFCHFLPFLALSAPLTTWKIKTSRLKRKHLEIFSFYTLHHKWQSYDVWFLRYWERQTIFFVILDHFFLFYTPNNLQNQNYAKMKKKPRVITILHMCTINGNNMMYGSLLSMMDTFFVILDHFLPFYPPPPTNPKNQNLKKTKTEKNT